MTDNNEQSLLVKKYARMVVKLAEENRHLKTRLKMSNISLWIIVGMDLLTLLIRTVK